MMAWAAGMSFVKMLILPFSGIIAGFSDGGSDAAGVPEGSSHAEKAQGFAFQMQSGMFERVARQFEQAQRNFLMKKEAEDQIKEIKQRQIAARCRLDSAKQAYGVYQKQRSHNQKTRAFYEKKFLDEELYSWMVDQLTMLYQQAYDMAHELALEAQRCWQYEIGDGRTQFIKGPYWNNDRRGFLAGELLETALLRMDKAYTERNERTFEITKKILLSELDPIAFIHLIQTGKCLISLNDSIFSVDYPDHYMRRIKTVTLVIATPNKPHNLNATLTQLSNTVVMEPDIDVVSFLQTGKTTKGEEQLDANLNQKMRVNYCNNQQITTSFANHSETGLFYLNMIGDPRYLPYEFTGAHSDWQLEIGLNENPQLCSTLGEALGIERMISAFSVDQLIQFLQAIQQHSSLAKAFHSEVFTRLKDPKRTAEMASWIEKIIKDGSLATWFKNFGRPNLNILLQRLTDGKKQSTADKLSAYIQAAKRLPTQMNGSGFTKGSLLNLTDVEIKISYTAKNGDENFKEKVRKLKAAQKTADVEEN